MKHTIISIILVVLVISAVTANIFFVKNVTDKMHEQLKRLPQTKLALAEDTQGSDIISDVQAYWFRLDTELSISVHTEESNVITLLLSDLKVYYENKNFELYKSSLERLTQLLQNMKEAELPSIKSIF